MQLDFTRLEKDGISKKEVLNFVKNHVSNFNYEELENYYAQQQLNENERTERLYDDLKNFKAFSLNPVRKAKKSQNIAQESTEAPNQAEPSAGIENTPETQDAKNNALLQAQAQAQAPESTQQEAPNTPETKNEADNTTQENTPETQDAKNNALLQAQAQAQAPESTQTQLQPPKDLTIIDNRSYEAKLNEIKEKAKQIQAPGFLDKLGRQISTTIDSITGTDFNYQLESQDRADELKNLAFKHGIAYKDLPNQLKEHMRAQKTSEGVFKGAYNAITQNAEEEYNNAKTLYNLARSDKTLSDLSEAEKRLIRKDAELSDHIKGVFTTDEQFLSDWKDKHKAKEATKEIQKRLTYLNNIAKEKGIIKAFTGLNEAEKKSYIQSVESVIKPFGFDNIKSVDNDLYIHNEKKGEWYKVNDNFLDNFTDTLKANAGSITGGILGAARGATRGVGGAVVGGAVGAFLGGGADAILTNAYLNREQKSSEILQHALQEGALNIVGDAAFLAAKPAGQAIKKLADTYFTYNLTGFGKRLLEGNTARAQEIIKSAMSEEQQEALKEFSQKFGGNLKLESTTDTTRQKIADAFKGKQGQKQALWAYDKVSEILLLNNKKDQQEAFIRAMRADESGNLVAFLAEAANQSPAANKALKDILNATTANLENQLKSLKLNKGDIKGVLDELETGTKESYDTAMNKVISGIYDDSYKVQLKEGSNPTAYQAMREELHKAGQLDQDALKFLGFVERNIYNRDGVTFNQLNNSLKTINAYLRNIKDPSTKGYIERSVQHFIKDDIKNATEALFKQNESAYKSVKDLYDTALSDYATMRESMRLADSAKLRDKLITQEKAIDNLLKITQGQGGDISNFQTLTKGLNEANKEVLELNMLDNLFSKAIQETQGARVFDSQAFFKELENFKGKAFTSKAAKDFLDIAQGFNKLFKNDANIASRLNAPSPKTVGSSIATTLEGAIKMRAVKGAFEALMRAMPQVKIFGKGFDEKTAGMALRYHVKKALERNNTIEGFKASLTASAKKSQFTNETMQKIEQITGALTPSTQAKDTNTAILIETNQPLQQEGNKGVSIMEQAKAERKAMQEKRAKEEAIKAQKLKAQQAEIRAQKAQQAGKADNERELKRGDKISMQKVSGPHSSVSLNDGEIYPLDFAIVKKDEIKPNFKASGTQTRTHYNEKTIQEIANNFDPTKIMGRGGYDDLPIVLTDGQIVAGNHRSQGMLNFTAESRKKYEEAIKSAYGIELKPDELLVRTPRGDLSDKEIINLAAKSNEGRANSQGDLLLSALAKHEKNIPNLASQLSAENVEVLQSQVARALDKEGGNLKDIKGANLALLAKVATNTKNHNLVEVLNSAQKELEAKEFSDLLDMFRDNAGSFWNLQNNTTLKNINLAPYLAGAIHTTAKALKEGSRADNLERIALAMKHLNDTTDKNGLNDLVREIPTVYEDLIAEALGTGLARFVRLENPSESLFKFLERETLENNLDAYFGPSLLGPGKKLSELDTLDFLYALLQSGRENQRVDSVVSEIEKFREKANAHARYLKERASARKNANSD